MSSASHYRLKFIFSFVFLLGILAVATGCGDKVGVTGRITFPDGKPLTCGQIIFTDDFTMARSDINRNGEYSLHSIRRNDGIKRGTYKVHIVGAIGFDAEDLPPENGNDASGDPKEKLREQAVVFAKPKQMIDMQYVNADASGWVREVKKRSRFDFTVYPPGEVPEEERTEIAKRYFGDEK